VYHVARLNHMGPKHMTSEKTTDIFIAGLLDDAGIAWNTDSSGIKEIDAALKAASKRGTGHAGRPEFVAQSGDFILVIENKLDRDKQALYTDDACIELDMSTKARMGYAENGALHYAQHIVANTNFRQVFAFGCSGNSKRHIIRPIFVDQSGYRLLDTVENFSNFSPDRIGDYYRQQVLDEPAPEELELEALLKQAKSLHEDLRNYGNLGETEKPLVVSAILLALSDDTFAVDNLKGSGRRTDGKILHDVISSYMKDVEATPSTKIEKVLEQFNLIKNRPALNQVDARLGKTPLRYFAERLNQGVMTGITADSPEDILGRFYGEFIRYSGGDTQELGVVLTPRHITELFCNLVDIKPDDRIFDPCCGTAGFLIAGMHHMLKSTQDKKKRQHIKQEQIFGVEIREDMFAIATTNMILRGDGKSNLENRDFLKIPLEELRSKSLSVGFINPPYSQGKTKDTAHLSEIRFIQHLLDGLDDGARCVAIVPQSTMVGSKKYQRDIKQQILDQHTLEGVITLNKDTFGSIGVNPCIAVFIAHQPHPSDKRVKFINFKDDGYEIKKHVGLVATPRAIEKKQALLDWWFDRKDTESRYMVKSTVEASDEWLHSFYYFNDEIPKAADFEKTINDYLTFEFSMVMQGRGYLFDGDDGADVKKKLKNHVVKALGEREWREFLIADIFRVSGTTTTPPSKLLKNGTTPRITCAATNNGLDDFYQNEATEKAGVLTVESATTGTITWQGHDFIATDHVEKLTLKKKTNLLRHLGFFMKIAIQNSIEGKYGYGYKFSQERIKKQSILLPVNTKGQPDYEYMAAYAKNIEHQKLDQYLDFIQKRLTKFYPPPQEPCQQQNLSGNRLPWMKYSPSSLESVLPRRTCAVVICRLQARPRPIMALLHLSPTSTHHWMQTSWA